MVKETVDAHLPALAVSALLLAAGCTTPDGRPDPGATAGLALGLVALGGLAFLASQGDDDDGHHARGRHDSRRQESRRYDDRRYRR